MRGGHRGHAKYTHNHVHQYLWNYVSKCLGFALLNEYVEHLTADYHLTIDVLAAVCKNNLADSRILEGEMLSCIEFWQCFLFLVGVAVVVVSAWH